MSLLLAHGHSYALEYPVIKVLVEADILTRHLNRQHATAASLIQGAISACLDGEANKEFRKHITSLQQE